MQFKELTNGLGFGGAAVSGFGGAAVSGQHQYQDSQGCGLNGADQGITESHNQTQGRKGNRDRGEARQQYTCRLSLNIQETDR